MTALAQIKQVEEWHGLVHEGGFAECHDQLCEFARAMREAIGKGESGHEDVRFGLVERVMVNQARMAVLSLGVYPTTGDVMDLGRMLRAGMVLMGVWTGQTYREVAERLFAGGPDDEEWHHRVVPGIIRDAELHRETYESILNEREGSDG